MTYLEQLYDGIEHIAKRHKDLRGINIELAEYIEGDWKKSGGPCTCEHWIIKCDKPNIEVRLDFKSLCYELQLEFNQINDGFLIVNRDPENWNKNYRNKEFDENEFFYPNFYLPLAFWRCNDAFFKKRYERFDAIIKYYKNKNGEDD